MSEYKFKVGDRVEDNHSVLTGEIIALHEKHAWVLGDYGFYATCHLSNLSLVNHAEETRGAGWVGKKVVRKYKLTVCKCTGIPMSEQDKVVHVGFQSDDAEDQVTVWVLHDLKYSQIIRMFFALATGLSWQEPCEYVGTAQSVVRPYVWHVFRKYDEL